MKSWRHIALVGVSVLILTSAEVLDLGQLDQYKPRLPIAPKVGGNTLWVSGKEGDGFDIELSPDTRAKLQGVFDGCGVADDHCYQDARNVLRSADLQIDAALERRGFAQLLSKTFKKLGNLYLEITAILLAEWKLQSFDNQQLGLFIPQPHADKASALATATAVVVSAQGSQIGTVMPTPDPTKLQGSQTPTVTLVTEPSAGFSKGDLAAILDADLAQRIGDLMHLMSTCDDGTKFDADKGSRKKHRATGTYGQAICGAEAVASMAGPGGPFNDLLLLRQDQMAFGFAEGAGEALRAANVVADFVLAYAPMLSITPDVANQLATYLMALAIDTIVENVPLKGENRIASSLVTTGPTATQTASPTSSQTGCPDPKTTPLMCGYTEEYHPDCDLKLPSNAAEEPVCASGPYKDCECSAPSDLYFNALKPDQVQFILDVTGAMQKASNNPSHPNPANKPECQVEKSSDIPSNIFRSEKNTVYGRFCDSWVAGTELKMTVDAAGNDRKPKAGLTRRTPPPNPDTWSHYNFDLSFEPTDKGKKCVLNCNDAFSTMTQACSNPGSNGNLMAKTGKLDVGCGIFDFNIVGPTVPLTAQDRHCYRPDEFGKHRDVQGGTVSFYSGHACVGTAITTIKRGDPSTNIHFERVDGGVPYQYNIYWKDGCLLDYIPGFDAVYPANPLNVKDPGYTTCQQFLIDNYKQCNNGGVGGSIQVGCLVYEFKAQKSST
ncbi:hypothetical protein GE09DRAFT_1089179 [Coniochaeta sp. 2T2.1]|nr:hypothetical protein GE09DRAFT_1089179 [Coniochaeta sp. 2T2.1]